MTNPFLNAPQGAEAPVAAPAPAGWAPASVAAPAPVAAPVAAPAPIAVPGLITTPAPVPAAGGGIARPSRPGGAVFKDDMGAALLVRPHEKLTVQTSRGPADAIRADWVVLDGPNQGQMRENSLIFGKVLVSELEAVIEGPSTLMAGRLGTRQPKDASKQPAIVLEDLDDATLTLAEQAQAAFKW